MHGNLKKDYLPIEISQSQSCTWKSFCFDEIFEATNGFNSGKIKKDVRKVFHDVSDFRISKNMLLFLIILVSIILILFTLTKKYDLSHDCRVGSGPAHDMADG